MSGNDDRIAWCKQEIERVREADRMLRSGELNISKAAARLLESRHKELVAHYERAIEALADVAVLSRAS